LHGIGMNVKGTESHQYQLMINIQINNMKQNCSS